MTASRLRVLSFALTGVIGVILSLLLGSDLPAKPTAFSEFRDLLSWSLFPLKLVTLGLAHMAVWEWCVLAIIDILMFVAVASVSSFAFRSAIALRGAAVLAFLVGVAWTGWLSGFGWHLHEVVAVALTGAYFAAPFLAIEILQRRHAPALGI